jgi:hypothetical protein
MRLKGPDLTSVTCARIGPELYITGLEGWAAARNAADRFREGGNDGMRWWAGSQLRVL